MDSSASTDSKLTIQLAADTSAATSALQSAGRDVANALRGISDAARDAGSSGSAALEKTADAARKTATEVRRVGESAKMTAGQLRMVAVGMAGMAMGAIGAYQDAHGGRSAGLAYTQGALSGGLQGAAMGAMVGGAGGAVVGGAIGAGVGAFTTYEQREAAEKAEQEARKRAIESMEQQIETYEMLRERTEAFQRTLAALGDEENSAAMRTEMQRRIVSEKEAEDERLAAAQRDAAARGDEAAFRSLTRDRTLNAQELSGVKAVVIAERPNDRGRFDSDRLNSGSTDDFQRRGFNLFGGVAAGVQDAATQLAREGNSIAREQLQVQRSFVDALRRTSSRLARWG